MKNSSKLNIKANQTTAFKADANKAKIFKYNDYSNKQLI